MRNPPEKVSQSYMLGEMCKFLTVVQTVSFVYLLLSILFSPEFRMIFCFLLNRKFFKIQGPSTDIEIPFFVFYLAYPILYKIRKNLEPCLFQDFEISESFSLNDELR